METYGNSVFSVEIYGKTMEIQCFLWKIRGKAHGNAVFSVENLWNIIANYGQTMENHQNSLTTHL